ncbi:MAG: leucyl-tRNA synthetase [Acidobacteriota bacterium]|jgi:leucyl-tRNA synthetase|nr:leucyl-tRNA synthetase [Acidobacteriota bacterium]
MDEKYYPEKIEEKWQKHWAETGAFEADRDDQRTPFYCLEMLPYPSGYLHIGHVRNYAIGEALAWFKRLQGFNVLHPFGWDSFGQPAEQAAIKRGINPREWTEDNIEHMRAQLKRIGVSYDWRREIAAHTPEYYKWDQWFFLKMYERGLAYKKLSEVNWCPKEETVLSNEQSSGGVCWRCGASVEKKGINQWFLRITDYAERLLDGMKEIEDGWPERVLTMQRNWIGRSAGAHVDFPVEGSEMKITVFTTRIDTVFGVNAISIAPEHPMLEAMVEGSPRRDEVLAFAEKLKKEKPSGPVTEEIEKQGIFTGGWAINPFSGERVPIWVANFVLIEYGTGAVMSVPSGDQRDFEFSRKYDLRFRQIKLTEDGREIPPEALEAADESWTTTVNTAEWSGLPAKEANLRMSDYAEAQGFGRASVTYKLRDWGISRQRFWGAPVPIIYCEKCGVVPVPEADLPVKLPEHANFTGTGESPLAGVADFVNTICPNCGGTARRETDTMDTFVDSSWYFFRYCDPRNEEMPFDPNVVAYWTPVSQYIGGVEHAVMHLLYTRFWTKFMRDIGLVEIDEPIKRLLTQGMVVAETFYLEDGEQKVYFNPADITVERDDKGRVISARLIENRQPVTVGPFEKMSKSKNNGVDPDDMISAYGADAVRLFILFAAPLDNDLRWQEAGIEGAVRFLRRVYGMVWRWQKPLSEGPQKSSERAAEEFTTETRALRRKTHQTIARITEDFEDFHFNTSVAALMELSNALGDFKAEPQTASDAEMFAAREALEALVIMLAPFAPHFAEEMWQELGHEGGILSDGPRWPTVDEELARKEELEIPVQINGKLRSRIRATPDTSEEELRATALADEKVLGFTGGREIVKVIVVPQRLVNIVVR